MTRVESPEITLQLLDAIHNNRSERSIIPADLDDWNENAKKRNNGDGVRSLVVRLLRVGS